MSFEEEIEQQAYEIAETTREGVVSVRESAAGWAYDKTHVVTAGHVVGSGSGPPIYTFHGEKLDTEIVGQTDQTAAVDAALLEVTDGELPSALETGDPSAVEKEDPLLMIGHPALMGYWVPSLGVDYGDQLYRDTARVAKIPGTGGNSGSPLIDMNGKVIGVAQGGINIPDEEEYEPVELKIYEQYPYLSEQKLVYNKMDAIAEKIEEWL